MNECLPRWQKKPVDFGYWGRWLINKDADGQGWLLHEPIADYASPATLLPTFKKACALFAAYTSRITP